MKRRGRGKGKGDEERGVVCCDIWMRKGKLVKDKRGKRNVEWLCGLERSMLRMTR